MSQVEQNPEETDHVRRVIFIVSGLLAALLIAGLVYLSTRPALPPVGERRLEGAVVRPGTSEFEQYRERIVVDSVEAYLSPRALGDQVMTLNATVRNFTDRTINGLELRGTVVDSQNNPVMQRTIIVIPSQLTNASELAPNRTAPASILLEGIKKDADLANFRVEVAGVKFK